MFITMLGTRAHRLGPETMGTEPGRARDSSAATDSGTECRMAELPGGFRDIFDVSRKW